MVDDPPESTSDPPPDEDLDIETLLSPTEAEDISDYADRKKLFRALASEGFFIGMGEEGDVYIEVEVTEEAPNNDGPLPPAAKIEQLAQNPRVIFLLMIVLAIMICWIIILYGGYL